MGQLTFTQQPITQPGQLADSNKSHTGVPGIAALVTPGILPQVVSLCRSWASCRTCYLAGRSSRPQGPSWCQSNWFLQWRLRPDHSLAAFIKNGFEMTLAHGAVFLDLTAAYSAVSHNEYINCPSDCLSGAFRQWNCCYETTVASGPYGRRCQFLAKAGEQFVLAPTLFGPCANGLPVTLCRGFMYVDDICCALQEENFSEIECTLTADLAYLAKYCQLWHLKPSTSKTVTRVFH